MNLDYRQHLAVATLTGFAEIGLGVHRSVPAGA